MRRADRLFQLVQLLHHERVITARSLAEALSVSERTIYRDIQDLSLSGVPIEGEVGVGYRLMRGFHLPSLMFSEEELAALLLGARMVQAWTDKALASAAHNAILKIENAVPERLKPELDRQELLVPNFSVNPQAAQHLTLLRGAIKTQQKLVYDYTRADGGQTNRVVCPLGLFYWGQVWTLVGWCELRDEFRQFRLDRMENVTVLDALFELLPGQLLQDYLSAQCQD